MNVTATNVYFQVLGKVSRVSGDGLSSSRFERRTLPPSIEKGFLLSIDTTMPCIISVLGSFCCVAFVAAEELKTKTLN